MVVHFVVVISYNLEPHSFNYFCPLGICSFLVGCIVIFTINLYYQFLL